MTKYHLTYRSFPELIEHATAAFFDSKPWQGDDDATKHEKFEGWLKAAARAYDIPAPTLAIVEGYAPTVVERPEAPEIVLDKYSVTNLFLLFRAWVNTQQDYDDQQSPFPWACSLFYKFHPRAFRRAVRRGTIMNMRPVDLIHPRAEHAFCVNCDESLWLAGETWRHIETGHIHCDTEDRQVALPLRASTALDDETENVNESNETL